MRKLTKAMEKAGITEIGWQLDNGAYQCRVDLQRVQLNGQTNYRQYDQHHALVINGRYKRHCLCSPKVIYTGDYLDTSNGRHTIHVMLDQGFKTAVVEVFFAEDFAPMSVDQLAAEIFWEIARNTKRMDSWASYNAALDALDPDTLTIEGLVDEFEFIRAGRPGYGMRNSEIRSVRPLYEAAQAGEDHIRKVFMMLAAWRDHHDEPSLPYLAGRCEFLRGVSQFVRTVPMTAMKRVAAMMARRSPDWYANVASGNNTRSKDRLSPGDFARVFDQTYNNVKLKAA